MLIQNAEQCMKEMLDTMKRKNADYTSGDNPYKNFQLVEFLGSSTAENAIFTRMCDKVSRLGSLIGGKEPQVKDEKVTDTLLDLANYCIILYSYMKDKKGGI